MKSKLQKPSIKKIKKKVVKSKQVIKKPIFKAEKNLKKSLPQKKRVLTGKNKKPVKKKNEILFRAEKNPIIVPKQENRWEAWQTFNPGAVLLKDRIHFIYRAIGEDGVSRLGYASSLDGFFADERLAYPVYEHKVAKPVFNFYASGGSFSGAEDPRLVQINGEDKIYMTYTACDGGLRVGLTSIKVKDFLQKKWKWGKTTIISAPGEVHKNWVIFPEKINGQYAIIHNINPQISIAYRDTLEFKDGEFIESFYNGKNNNKNCWDKWVRGAGAPPIKTKKGWLLFYHAMDNDFSKYKVGAMLLDLKDPTKILYRSNEPIFEPEKEYENYGFKPGIVYVSGVVVKDGELLVFYGSADSYISVAHSNLEKFLNKLINQASPKLKTKAVKKK